MSSATYDLHALIKEARRRARQRRWAYAGVLTLLAGAGIWGGVALSGGSGAIPAPPAPPGYHLVKARGDVQHALLAGSFQGTANGYPRGKRSRERVEVWFDRKAGLIRTRGCWFGSCADQAARCVPACAFSAPLLERYWPVDTTKFVRRPGLGSFHGRQVVWLGKFENTFPPAWGNGEWIALDLRTHDPVGDRKYSTTYKPMGQLISETWVVRRFPDVAPNRFWFAVKNTFDARVVHLQPLPLYVPGEPVPDMPQASRIVVGRLAGATIFASVRRDGSWRFFSVSRDGRVDGHSRIDDPHTLQAGLVVRHGTLFSGHAYLVVAGSMFARRDTKLFAVFADGSRQRIKLIASGKPAGPTAFHYYLIAKAQQVRARPVMGLQLVRGSRVLARPIWPLGYQAPEGPAPLPLRAALRAFDS
jgi:hypothetical protein